MKPKIKIRKYWTRNPVEKIKDSSKKYDRKKNKREFKKLIDNEVKSSLNKLIK